MAGWFAYNQMLVEGGHFVAGASLQPSSTATVVHNGTGAVTDGPYTETKEQIGGFYVVKADDLDEALALAGKMPAAGRRSRCDRSCSARTRDGRGRRSPGLAARGRAAACSPSSRGRLGDLDLADEAVQDALLEAVRIWPDARRAGQPGRPGC